MNILLNYAIDNISFNIIVTVSFLISYIIFFELKEHSKIKTTGLAFLFLGVMLLSGNVMNLYIPISKTIYIGKLIFIALLTILIAIPKKVKVGYPGIILMVILAIVCGYFVPNLNSIPLIASGTYGKTIIILVFSLIGFFLSKTSRDTRIYAVPIGILFISALIKLAGESIYVKSISQLIFMISGIFFIINIKDFKLKERHRNSIEYEKIKKDFDEEVEKEVKKRMFYVELSKEKISEKSRTDGLTGALNKNAILDEMDTLIMNKQRYSMLIFDIDKFKTLNDTLGHIAGDMCLKTLSNLCKSHITKDDHFGRYGGDEFIIVLPGKRYNDALKFGEELRKLIEQKTDPKFTISIGVAEFPHDGFTVKEVLHWGDESLYISKHKGRNTVSHKKSKLYMKKHGIEEEES